MVVVGHVHVQLNDVRRGLQATEGGNGGVGADVGHRVAGLGDAHGIEALSYLPVGRMRKDACV